MLQDTIGRRLKFLMESLDLKVRTFAGTLDVSKTNIRNYISRNSKPSSDILERILQQYPQVNALWLLTGRGEPLSLPANENNRTTAHAEIFMENLKTKLALIEQENEHLKAQLAMKDALLTSKEETLVLLRASYNRPN